MDRKRIVLDEHPTTSNRITAGDVRLQSNKIPKPAFVGRKSKWTFGFQFFSQIKYFEVGGVNNSWFISLMERLKAISNIDREVFLKDYFSQKSLRYHKIDWNSKNVPISRTDLHWIDKAYLNNDDEYPLVQFHVSKALGRIIGFWDEMNVFQVVLLDPLHNIQPSKYNEYHVDDTYHMSCEYSSLLLDIQRIKIKAGASSCEVCDEIKSLPTKLNKTNFVYLSLDDSYVEKLNSSELPIQDIIELGLLST